MIQNCSIGCGIDCGKKPISYRLSVPRGYRGVKKKF